MEVPKVVIGSLRIIKPKERVSTAIVLESRKEIAIGEIIEHEKNIK